MLVSVVVPVYRERPEDLARFAGRLTGQADERVEIIFVSTDSERESLRGILTAGRLIIAARGRASQMNAGAAWAKGRYLLFLHCDTMLEDGWIDSLAAVADAGWGAFTPRVDGRGFVLRLAELWGLFRSSLLGLPYGDQGIFVSRRYFEYIGGFDTETGFMEDLDLASRLGLLLGPPRILPDCACTSDRAWRERGGMLYSLRNLLLLSLFLAGVHRKYLERLG